MNGIRNTYLYVCGSQRLLDIRRIYTSAGLKRLTMDNNYWIVTNNVKNSPIKSIKMYSLFSENSQNKDHQSPVMFQDLPRKPIIISK